MKKILLIIALLIVCAALEVPEDYQWSSDSACLAKISTAENSPTIHTSMQEERLLPEFTLSL